jgi:hypothetical protein
MTQDEIIEMAIEAEFVSHGKPSDEESELFVCVDKDIYKFAKLIAEKGRTWVGLTEVEIIGMTCDCEKITMDCMIDFANSIQNKLKEINE